MPECHYSGIMLNVIMLNVITPNMSMPHCTEYCYVVMPSVIRANVVAPVS